MLAATVLPAEQTQPPATQVGPTSRPHEDPLTWLYRHEWVAARRGAEWLPRQQRWLVLHDSGPVGRGLVTLLRERGDDVATVTAAAAYQCVDRHRFQVNPSRPDDMVARTV